MFLKGIFINLQKFLEELELDDSDSEDIVDHYENIDGFKIYKECWDNLYPYQKDGVRWFWNLYTEKKGGILGDDMGFVFLFCLYIGYCL